jgi:hypothetical protein
MRNERGYRAPLAVLRRFTRSDIALRVTELRADKIEPNAGAPAPAACDPADLSLAVSAWIASRFHGDREAAMRSAVHQVTRALGAPRTVTWPPGERAAFESFCLLLARVPDLARWPARDKSRAIAVARAKGGDEFRYFDLLRDHPRLQASLRRIAAKAN